MRAAPLLALGADVLDAAAAAGASAASCDSGCVRRLALALLPELGSSSDDIRRDGAFAVLSTLSSSLNIVCLDSAARFLRAARAVAALGGTLDAHDIDVFDR